MCIRDRLTVADVFGRLFNSPIPGTFEIVGFTGAAVIAFALPYTSVTVSYTHLTLPTIYSV